MGEYLDRLPIQKFSNALGNAVPKVSKPLVMTPLDPLDTNRARVFRKFEAYYCQQADPATRSTKALSRARPFRRIEPARRWDYGMPLNPDGDPSASSTKVLTRREVYVIIITEMRKDSKSRSMTQLLREALIKAQSLSEVERATGLKRQALAKFMRGEQSLRLDLADILAKYFGIESRAKEG